MRFNLVIERLLISGRNGYQQGHPDNHQVSISLSSGFSFQVGGSNVKRSSQPSVGFNLVIERLLISGRNSALSGGTSICFNLVIERLLISGPSPRSP